MRRLSRPSSTITASTLATMGMTVVWELFAQFGFEARPTLVAASVAFVGAFVGYLKKENVLPLQRGTE